MKATIDELDITQPGFFLREDYYELLAWLRANDPVHQVAGGDWLVSTYEEIREISRQPMRFASRFGALINDPARFAGANEESGSLIHLDPPRHAEFRKLLNRRFTPKAVAHLDELVRAMTDDALAELAPGDEVDAVERIAIPVPVAVIAELLGVSDGDQRDFRRWSDAAIEVSDFPSDENMRATGELFHYFRGIVRDRRARPGDDLVSMLVQGDVAGNPLTDEQLMMFCFTLLVAGNETTRSLISGGLEALAEHPDQRSRLMAEPALLTNAVEECLRWVTPIQVFCRTAVEPVELAGTEVPEGAYLVMLYASGNRDERAFGPTADRFDVGRPASPGHVAFGFGEHLCLGAALARLEARVVFEQVLARFPDYALAGPATLAPSTLTRSLTTLPLTLA